MSEVSEKSIVKLTISSWFHVIVVVITIVLCFAGLRADIRTAKEQSERNAIELVETQKSLTEQKSDVRSIRENLDWFRKKYEEDMNRYIRDYPSRK